MKIDNGVGNSKMSGSEHARKTSEANAQRESSRADDKNQTSKTTQANISARAREMADAKGVASQTPGVREAKVAEMKAKYTPGAKVDAESLADKMLQEHLEEFGLDPRKF